MDVTVWYDPDIDAVVATYRGTWSPEDSVRAADRIADLLDRRPSAGLLTDTRGLLEAAVRATTIAGRAHLFDRLRVRPRAVAALGPDPDANAAYVEAMRARDLVAESFTDLDTARWWIHSTRSADAPRSVFDDSLQGA